MIAVPPLTCAEVVAATNRTAIAIKAPTGFMKNLLVAVPVDSCRELYPRTTPAAMRSKTSTAGLIGEGNMAVRRISAITLRVSDMARSVGFYSELLGLELLYGGSASSFSSLRTTGAK